LGVGPHTVVVEAQGYRPYTATVTIRANQTRVHDVTMAATTATTTPTTPPGVNCEATNIGLANRNHVCYDTRPNPRGLLQIAVPDGCPSGATAATILLRVSAEGQVVVPPTATVRGSCPAFALAAAAYAQDLSFRPATKNNAAVAAWVTILIRPAPRQ
ncbi:MAG: PEGA domain-containing protein, partial [Gemmatimonadales bacterium]|nr:PEGA domain-containing protein [Gemmatimonadales bacterium]